MLIDWDVPIEMDDGLVLRADVFRPTEAGRHPVLLSYGPYGKSLAFQDGYPSAWQKLAADHPDVTAGSSNKYQAWEVVDPEKWVPYGYAIVRVDSRGAGRSPGYLDNYSARERHDLVACIEWAAAQPWSTGKVGMNGISYYAVNQWHAAAERPEALAAICVWEGAADAYRDRVYHGGIRNTYTTDWYDMQVKTVQYGFGARGERHPVSGLAAGGDETLSDEELERNRADLAAEHRGHRLDSAYWRERSVAWSRVDVPLLTAANWGGQGLHPRGNVCGFEWAATPDEDKYLECHGLEHWTHFYTDYGRELQRRFFDWYLKGEGDWKQTQPHVLLNVRRPGDRFELRAESEWPLARTRWTTFWLDAASCALSTEPAHREAHVSYRTAGEGVTFRLAAFERETELCGPIAAKLFISSTTADADLFLVVRLFDPDGEEVVFTGAVDPHTPVAQGWLRASHRKLDAVRTTAFRPYHAHDEIQPLEPGRVYEVDVEIWPTGIVCPPGHVLALTVQGHDYEWAGEPARFSNFKHPLRGCGPFLHDDPVDRPPDLFDGIVTLHTGGIHGAYLLVPVIPSRLGS